MEPKGEAVSSHWLAHWGGRVVCRFASEDAEIPTSLCFTTSGLLLLSCKVQEDNTQGLLFSFSGNQQGKKTLYKMQVVLHG